jgi:flagellar motor protein MotB
MRVVAVSAWLGVLALSVAAGCANNPYALQRQNQALQQQQLAMQQRNQELQSKASTLDHDNQELETLLAQTRQQSKVMEDQLAAVRDQLATTSAQLGKVRDEKQLSDKQTEALVASTRRRTGAKITANNSLQRSLPAVNLPGVEVRPDGDVVRVELPSAKLFQPGSTVLQPVAGSLLDAVAAELARAYPDQKIGVEGHTDGDFVRSPQGGDNQQLSVARATAVYQYLSARNQIPASRMFIVGYGANQPVVSNATAAGKARNGRVELVVYPDKVEAGR